MPLRKKIHNIKDQSNPPKFLNSLLRMSTPQRLYVLELQHGKYYVGITNNLQRRFQQHLDGTGSAWTREHAPVAVHITTALEGPLHEDRVTKEMMLEHGIDNVRGGAYCKVQLDEEQHAALTTEMRSASGVCLMCGRAGHFAAQCWKNQAGLEKQTKTKKRGKLCCFRCGRDSHLANACYARTDVDGDPLSESSESESESDGE